jgi:hypothetical protein
MKLHTLIPICLLVLTIPFGCTAAIQKGTVETVTAKVTEKTTVVRPTGEGGSKSVYLIYTDRETFSNEDTLFHGKFNSSDLYGKIKAGRTYKMQVYGWRIPFLSMYRNIVSITPTK